jgi:hypothetical protein
MSSCRSLDWDEKEVPMKRHEPDQTQANADEPTTDALSEDELRELEGEPLARREAMSTLVWAPGPPTTAIDPVSPLDAEGA